MKYETLQIAAQHGVCVIWMNRAEVRNAFNETMIAELTQAFQDADADEDIRAVVLAGHGPAFCAGADLNWMKKMAGYNQKENHADAVFCRELQGFVFHRFVLGSAGDALAGNLNGDCHHIRNTPKRVASIGAFNAAESARPSTLRVSSGAITPSSHSRALA